ncbi:AraC family transcriptional regulator [Amycolatopsis thermoflava]|uniref:AraC family transcriptional regulator n=1 Tax=Amycolatopsis thermoflava TaxID=84480 RepID=UPI003EC03D95
MDELAGLLDGPRARGAFLLRAQLAPPWSMRIQDEAPLTLVAVLRGSAWVCFDDGTTRKLTAGDVAVLRGPDPYTFCDHPDTTPQVVVGPEQVCTTPAGQEVVMTGLGLRTWGNDPHGPTTLLVGTYQLSGEVSRRLLGALPVLVVVAVPDSPVMTLLGAEISRDEPGQEAVLDRLLDLLLIDVLRKWFAGPESGPWYRAYADPVVGRALRLLQHRPEHPWTVATLAAATGVSRAALARRFTELVGEPPMAYLTGWRLALAADLLRDPDTTLAAVARRVGYSSPFALSAAFKRAHGVSPQRHRRGAAARPG